MATHVASTWTRSTFVHYRRLVTRWREWVNVVEDSRLLATAVIDRLAGGPR